MRMSFILLTAAISLVSAPTLASPRELPPDLKAWVPWVLEGHEELLCPSLGTSGSRPCAWPGTLQLEVQSKTVKFELAWDIFGAEQKVHLPGSERARPRDVRDGAKPALMVSGAAGETMAHLLPGHHVLRGEVPLETSGEMKVPANIGIVTVREAGKWRTVRRDEDGFARWGASESEVQDDRFSVRVFRKFWDGIPGQLLTRVVLDVSGKAREVVLGRVLTSEFSPVLLSSDVPASLDAEGRLRVQVRPGTHTITLNAVTRAELVELKRPKPDSNWPRQEIWSVEGVPAHRVVVVSGSAAVDPGQSDVPAEWRAHSAYPVAEGTGLQLEVLPFDAQQGTLWLLQRRMWQDLDGKGYTFQDTLRGDVSAPERLSLRVPLDLKELRLQDQPAWLVVSPPPGTGPSVRVSPKEGETIITAVGRIDSALSTLPAAGWGARVQNASTSLFLRPGSTVFHVAGVDTVSDTWVKRWDLMRAFLLTILIASAARLSGKRAAVVLGASAVVLLPDESFLVGTALLTAVLAWMVATLASRTHVLVRVVRWTHWAFALWMMLALGTVAAKELRHVLHPTLAQSGAGLGGVSVMEMMGTNPRAADTAEAAQDPTMPKLSPPASASAPMTEENVALALSAFGSAQSAPSQNEARKKSADYSYAQDPNAVVQAGPGLPAWRVDALTFGWTGTVNPDACARVFAVGPLGTSLLGLVKIAAMVALALWVLPRRWALAIPEAWRSRGLGLLPMASMLALCMLSHEARADLPSKELLDELRERMTLESAKAIAEVDETQIRIRGDALTLRMRVHATGLSAVALPKVTPWTAMRVQLDGKPAGALILSAQDDGPDDLAAQMRSPVSEGVHELVYEGLLPASSSSLEIGFGPHVPHRVSVDAQGWAADGVSPLGHSESSVRLTRAAPASLQSGKSADDVQAAPQSGAEWHSFRVTRTLSMGLTWVLSTEVSRTSPGSALRFKLPAFPGETPLSTDAVVLDGGVLSMTVPPTGSVTWSSLLPARPGHLDLRAASEGLVFETWRFLPGAQWALDAKGVKSTRGSKDAPYTFLPWPGQTLALEVSALAGAAGASLSIESSELRATPGDSGADFDLELSLRTTRGSTHMIVLPEGAQDISVTGSSDQGGAPASASVAGRNLHLVLVPGKSRYRIHFRTSQAWSVVWSAPSLDLGAPSTNAHVTLLGVGQRWVFGAWGKGVAPIVLLLGILLGVGGLAWILSRYRAIPLTAAQWALLLVGFVTSSTSGLVFVIGWFVATANFARAQSIERKWRRRFVFGGYGLLALFMLVTCLDALSKTFTGYPESYIEGADCSAQSLAWYMDRVNDHLGGVATCLSLPMWSYRLAMFVWALLVARLAVRVGAWAWGTLVPRANDEGNDKARGHDETS